MSKGPLHASSPSDIEYWARKLWGKKYEYLTDAQASKVWDALEEFLLKWQEEMQKGG